MIFMFIMIFASKQMQFSRDTKLKHPCNLDRNMKLGRYKLSIDSHRVKQKM